MPSAVHPPCIVTIIILFAPVLTWIIIGSIIASNHDTKSGYIVHDQTTRDQCCCRRAKTYCATYCECLLIQYIWFETTDDSNVTSTVQTYNCRNILGTVPKNTTIPFRGYYQTVTTDCFINVMSNLTLITIGFGLSFILPMFLFAVFILCQPKNTEYCRSKCKRSCTLPIEPV